MTRSELLSESEVQRRLAELPGWSGDSQRIRRSLELPADRLSALLGEVDRVQEELDHHAQIEEREGGVTFVVWTHSAGGVTGLDFELALRLNAVLDG